MVGQWVSMDINVLGELELKHVSIEEVLQVLVGEVDAELLKRVRVKGFETVNVKNTNGVHR
jgi:hypothetical protein